MQKEKEKKFKVGDRVFAILYNGERVSAEVIRYDNKYGNSVWCLWDDDNKEATIDEYRLFIDHLYHSPLMKALR